MMMEGDPLRADRRHDDRRPRGRRDAGLHLPALRVSARAPRAERGDRGRVRATAIWAPSVARLGTRVRSRSPARRRRLHLRRRDRDAREPRGQARHGAVQAAAARDQRAVRQAHGRQQRDHARDRADHPRQGAEFYRDFGMGRSRGTLPIQLAGNIKHGGLVEKAFGLTLRELLYDYGGGSRTGRPIRAVQVGGPLGAYMPESQFDTPLDYEAFAAMGAMVGHGGIVVFDDTVDMAAMARYAMEFCAIESCGKCTPCRIGSTRGVEVIDRVIAARAASDPTAQQRVRAARGPVRHDGRRLAVRAGRHDAVSGAERAQAFPGRFRSAAGGSSPARPGDEDLIMSVDLRHRRPARRRRVVRANGHADDRRRAGHRARRHVGHARRRATPASAFPSCAPPTPRGVRLVPAVPGRDRRPQGLSGLVHHAGRAGMKVRTQIAEAGRAAPRRDGALHLRSPARLPHLPGQRQLRAAGHGRRGGPSRSALRLRRRATTSRRRRTNRNPYFTFDPSKCIVCSRCVRACDEVQGTFALTIHGRGFDSEVSPGQDEPFLDSECVSCGACVEACPTATLMEKVVDRAWPARPQRDHHLRLLRRRLLVQGGDEGQRRWCAWCRTRTATPTTATPASRAASPGATRRTGPHHASR